MGWLHKVKEWAARDWEKNPLAVVLLSILAILVIVLTVSALLLLYEIMMNE